jgi:hypothetical protein
MVCGDRWWLLSRCQQAAQKTAEEATKAGDVDKLKDCSEVKYLAVARKTMFEKPVVDMEAQSYDGGELHADVLVFDIDTAKYLGGFKAVGKTPDSLEQKSKATNVEQWLHELIGAEINTAVRAKLQGP